MFEVHVCRQEGRILSITTQEIEDIVMKKNYDSLTSAICIR